MAEPTPSQVALVRTLPDRTSLIASCGPSTGWSYYPETKLVRGKDAGWAKDKVAGGSTALVRFADGQYDIWFADGVKSSASTRDEGGTVALHRFSEKEAAFIVSYPGQTVELYQFIMEPSGGRMIHAQSKGPENVVPKGALLTSRCQLMRLSGLG
jgi:hypothetical protein